MITSPVPPHLLDKIRRLAGPNPEGSKLTDIERLHLIFLLGAMVDPETSTGARKMARGIVVDNLTERGLTEEDLTSLFDRNAMYTQVQVADMIAVHPKLHHPYLD